MTTDPLNLPPDLRAFLQQGRPLLYDHKQCECGHVTLIPFSKLTLGEVWINPTRHTSTRIGPPKPDAVHDVVPAVNLISSAEGYDGEYVLCWLPTLGVFAAADVEHGDVTTFPGVTWTQIAADPIGFLEAQWFPPEASGGQRLLASPALERRPGSSPSSQ